MSFLRCSPLYEYPMISLYILLFFFIMQHILKIENQTKQATLYRTCQSLNMLMDIGNIQEAGLSAMFPSNTCFIFWLC